MTLLLRADDVRALIAPADALEAVKGAFVRLARGEATVPEIMDFEFPDGEAHELRTLNGELRHALAAAVRLADVVPLGTLPRRSAESDVTVCDLVGIGVQDAAIAGLLFRARSSSAAAFRWITDRPILRAGTGSSSTDTVVLDSGARSSEHRSSGPPRRPHGVPRRP